MKNNKFIKIVSTVMASALALGVAAGCSQTKEADSGKVEITIGNWPTDASANELKIYNARKEAFEKANPDIKINTDTYAYTPDTFAVKASANQLPNMYNTFFTESKKIIEQGFAADITEVLDELGWTKSINPDIAQLLQDEDGKIYGIPCDAYAQGLAINKALFTQAGLVNDDGSVKIPGTLDEVAEYAKIIKEKTGKPGFALPTTANCGGWHFINIAWDYGTTFMEKDDNGKYKATFDSKEAKDALQYVKDLKWKYKVLPDNTVIDNSELRKMFAVGQAGMIFYNPPYSEIAIQYGMKPEDMVAAKMPEGPAGRYAQMGGNVRMFSTDSTPEQIKACLKWIEFVGDGPTINDEQFKTLSDTYKNIRDEGGVVMHRDAFNVWVNEETLQRRMEAAKEYVNIPIENCENYFGFEGVVIKPEEPACCQELYATLDKCIQAVLTDEKADVDALISNANKEFQLNYLDKQ